MEEITTYIITGASHLPAIQQLIFIVAGVIGLFSVIGALIRQASGGRRGEPVLPETVAGIVSGSLLFSLPAAVNIVSFSFLGEAADPRIITSAIVDTGDKTKTLIQVVVTIITIMGWIAVARGFICWRDGPKYNRPNWFYKGTVFFISGSIAINFYVVANILSVSFGASEIGTNYFKF